MSVFVDTNVLIDFVCNRDGFYDDAESVFALGMSGKIDICFTDVSVINAIYVGRKYNYTSEELCDLLCEMLKFCNISQMDDSVILDALKSNWKDKEDATQYFSARASSAEIIVTRNVKDFALSEIDVMTPSQFVEKYR